MHIHVLHDIIFFIFYYVTYVRVLHVVIFFGVAKLLDKGLDEERVSDHTTVLNRGIS